MSTINKASGTTTPVLQPQPLLLHVLFLSIKGTWLDNRIQNEKN